MKLVNLSFMAIVL